MNKKYNITVPDYPGEDEPIQVTLEAQKVETPICKGCFFHTRKYNLPDCIKYQYLDSVSCVSTFGNEYVIFKKI